MGNIISSFLLITLFFCSPPAFSDTLSIHIATIQSQAEQGDREAEYNIGVMNYAGTNMPENRVEAAKWFSKSAEQNYAPAQYNLGMMYYKGDGVPKDYAAGFKLIHKAADQGFPDAIRALDAVTKASQKDELHNENIAAAIAKPIVWIIFIILVGIAVRRKRKAKDTSAN